ncbi:adenylosuccinate lyase [Corallococcus sp. H22C18031201]|uniref:adenylosuccinate lyase n=1 Tax=Citreicoccus inhibens TaxID=2849499 RepID=UPI000E749209|nr:adenylosuccinate lyase [Citreicoccus inhibens]MBU8897685.1 adenylosuccinate lyase [Citreicoccus inhibens]RJS27458.1 adenylosuccinate lyase [Corallococcus sp. H22C18031201]
MIPRYSRKEMASLWSDVARYRRWRDVELAALEGMVEAGLAPREALVDCLARAGDFTPEDAARIEEIERVTKHDVIAFLTFMEERVGPSARWLHLGMTSSDVLDTSLGMTMRDAMDLILTGVDRVMAAVERRAFEHKNTLQMGRSHGIHAEPITFGHKLAIWYDELRRGRERLMHARDTIAVGKISGAVGTFAHLPPTVEAHACQKLGLKPAPASSQVIQRDRHAEFFTALALLGSSIEKFAVEVRHLQRTEVREAEEAFTPGQKGSSAMPHKRNPILSENLTGLARLLRGFAVSAMEDVALWHERDISHSSVERVIGPDATILMDFMLHRFAGLMENMRVYPEQMQKNLDLLGGVVNSQRLLLELARKGMDRQAAYVIVQRNAMKMYEEGVDFRQALLADADLRKMMSAEEISDCFSPGYHTRQMDEIFRRVFGRSA